MTIKIFFSIRCLNLEGVEKFSYYVISILSNHDLKEQLFSEEFKQAAGKLALAPNNSSAFACVHSNIDKEAVTDVKQFLYLYTQTVAALFHSFLQFLWFIKDNSVSYKELIAGLEDNGQFKHLSFQNYEVATDSKGLMGNSSFTQAELMDTAKLYTHYQQIITNHKILVSHEKERKKKKNKDNSNPKETPDKLIAPEQVVIPEAISKDYNKMPLIERALMFIFSARIAQLLPNKLSSYIQALECLFVCEGGGELTQKLSERVAFYIGEKKNRKHISDILKEAYKVRSKYVHGDKIPNGDKPENLMLLCLQIDHIARQIFNKIIREDYDVFLKLPSEQKQLDDYLSDLIFQ